MAQLVLHKNQSDDSVPHQPTNGDVYEVGGEIAIVVDIDGNVGPHKYGNSRSIYVLKESNGRFVISRQTDDPTTLNSHQLLAENVTLTIFP